jgi:nitrite reductase/ring-hydroxylating ferredoxin subunit
MISNLQCQIGALYLGDLVVESPPMTKSEPKVENAMAPPPPSASNNEASTATDAAGDIMHWVDVADATQLDEEDARLLVQVPSSSTGASADQGRWVALVRCDGELHAIDATCYHMGGPLVFADIEDLDVKLNKDEQAASGGKKLKKDACLNCPWHHYKIRLSDGHRLHLVSDNKYEASEEPKQRKHLVKVENNRVWVHLKDCEEHGGPKEVSSDG